MNRPELISEKKIFGYEQEMLSHDHPSNIDDDDHFSARDKRESSMLDISNQQGLKVNSRKHQIMKRREAKQEKAQISLLFKELMTLINIRYLAAQALDLKVQNFEPDSTPANKKSNSFISKKNKEEGEKVIRIKNENETKIKEKLPSVMTMDKKEAYRHQKQQVKEEVLKNYRLLMNYEIIENEVSTFRVDKDPRVKDNTRGKNMEKQEQKQKEKMLKSSGNNKKSLSFFSYGQITILPQLCQKPPSERPPNNDPQNIAEQDSLMQEQVNQKQHSEHSQHFS